MFRQTVLQFFTVQYWLFFSQYFFSCPGNCWASLLSEVSYGAANGQSHIPLHPGYGVSNWQLSQWVQGDCGILLPSFLLCVLVWFWIMCLSRCHQSVIVSLRSQCLSPTGLPKMHVHRKWTPGCTLVTSRITEQPCLVLCSLHKYGAISCHS